MRSLFNNRSVGNEVTIDLDEFYEIFLMDQEDVLFDVLKGHPVKPGATIHIMRDRLDRFMKKAMVSARAVYRRSSNGHVHLRLIFAGEVSVLDAFMIRAWMFDDQTRLSKDLARYLMTGDLNEMNRTFDEKGKVENGEVIVRQAGEWIPINKMDALEYPCTIRTGDCHYRILKAGTYVKSEEEQKELGFV